MTDKIRTAFKSTFLRLKKILIRHEFLLFLRCLAIITPRINGTAKQPTNIDWPHVEKWSKFARKRAFVEACQEIIVLRKKLHLHDPCSRGCIHVLFFFVHLRKLFRPYTTHA